MSRPIEDYAFIGDCESGALVAKDGSIDWLCLPRFDSPACFAALLGTEEHGRWRIAPAEPVRRVRRRYREHTLVLETEFETDSGRVQLVDFMPLRGAEPDVVRIVVGREGRVPMRMDLRIRFDYGAAIPWVRRRDHVLRATAGPDTAYIHSEVEMHGQDMRTVAEFTVEAGQQIPWTMMWCPTHHPPPECPDPLAQLEQTEKWWREWCSHCQYEGKWREPVMRSLITLKALTYAPTGGVVAAATTSLPEHIGGVRNWDYRYCWLRDATMTLYSLIAAGYLDEACQWRDWLVNAVAGTPSQAQIMYGLSGERRLPELELDWLPGYENSAPVRIGNGAAGQFQLDVYGQVIDTLHVARENGVPPDENGWRVELAMLEHLESVWQDPDKGIWEVRGPDRHFTHSKVMAWVAFDRAVKSAEMFGLSGDVERWKQLRGEIHEQVCREGFDQSLNSFVQYYGSRDLDASLLMLPLVGFLPADDPRMKGTVEAVQKHLVTDGFVYRYRCDEELDNLPPGEGAFFLCTFWLVDNLVLQGRDHEAHEMYEQLISLTNDVGLLAEQYDPAAGRMLGNFPQAFSHLAVINTAQLLAGSGPERTRGA